MEPTVAMFKDAVDEFADADDDRVQMAIEQAKLFVDPAIWAPQDYLWGVIYLAAHLLATRRASTSSGSGGSSKTALDSELFVSSVSIGDRRVSFQKRASGAASSMDMIAGKLDATSYGNLFVALRRRNIPLIAVI